MRQIRKDEPAPRFLLTGTAMVLALCLAGPAWAASKGSIGKAVPFFRVESGDGKLLDTRMIKGKANNIISLLLQIANRPHGNRKPS